MKKFKVGDVVTLKSGSPKMTVRGYRHIYETVMCQWFEEDNLRDGDFEEDLLVLVTE